MAASYYGSRLATCASGSGRLRLWSESPTSQETRFLLGFDRYLHDMGASRAQIENFLTSVLRGLRGWPDGWGADEIQCCLELSDEHGIQPLLHRAMREAPGVFPGRLRDELARAARDAAATELIWQHDVAKLVFENG